MAKGDDIQERLIALGVMVADLSELLPSSPAGRHFADQLLRAGTSPASNYGEARAAESRRDFGHKLGIVFKELKETSIWLDMIKRRGMGPVTQVAPLQEEANALCRIIAVSLRTLRSGNNT